MKFINQKSVFKINKCEECAFTKAYKIVSRFFDKLETSEKSFFCITYDLIVINIAMNKDQWIFYVTCFIIDFHMIYTHSSKTQIIKILIRVIYIIKTKYENKIVFVRSNDKRALKIEWDTYIIMKKIIYEFFAMNTFI